MPRFMDPYRDLSRPIRAQHNAMGSIPRVRRGPGVLTGLAGLMHAVADAAAYRTRQLGAGADISMGLHSVQNWWSFRWIVEIPFETCVTALESWQLTGRDGGRRTGRGPLRGPVEHDRDSGTCRIEVRLSRGSLRPPLRMRLDIDRWSSSPAKTALELIPCERVRPSASYFRAGHLLLDSLTRSLAQDLSEQRFDRVNASQPQADPGEPRPGRPIAGSAALARPQP